MAQSVHVTLAGHADNPACFRQRIDVTLTRTPASGVVLAYRIHGPNFDLRVPTEHAPAPADALWRTTCCELFAGTPDHSAYREFNFSPSGQWAFHDFLDTRQHASYAPICPAPRIACRRSEELLCLDIELALQALPAGSRHCLALAVVLETRDGRLGYWALAHAPGRPDFHQPNGFLLKLDARGFSA